MGAEFGFQLAVAMAKVATGVDPISDELLDFFRFRETAFVFSREYQLVVEPYFQNASGSRLEGDLADIIGEGCEELLAEPSSS